MKGYGNFEDYFYVENKFTKKVYQSPDFLKEAIDCKIIPVIGEIFENKSALMTVMKEKGFTLIDRDATINELLAKVIKWLHCFFCWHFELVLAICFFLQFLFRMLLLEFCHRELHAV